MTKKLTLIKRSVPACSECVMQEKVLEGAGIPFKSIDIAHDEGAIDKYGISSIPVMIFEDAEGIEEFRFSRFRPAELVAEMLK